MKSCMHPMMIPFMHFFIIHMSYLTVRSQCFSGTWHNANQQLQLEEVRKM